MPRQDKYDIHTYVLRASNGVSVAVKRGEGAPQIVGGGARWDVITRPRRTSQIQWNGDDPYTMDLPVLFDGWMDSVSVERDIQSVNQMLHSPGAWVEPTTIRITGGVPVKGATWVLTGIDYGDMGIWDVDKRGKGFRYRQDATLHLLQYIPETVLQFNIKPSATTPYVVKHGDTLASIAAKHKTTPAKVKKANNIRDHKKITPGQTIKVPGQKPHTVKRVPVIKSKKKGGFGFSVTVEP